MNSSDQYIKCKQIELKDRHQKSSLNELNIFVARSIIKNGKVCAGCLNLFHFFEIFFIFMNESQF